MYTKIGLDIKKDDYYIYEFINPLTGKCFYVGKGKSNRYKIHFYFQDNNKLKQRIIRKILNKNEKVIINISYKSKEEKIIIEKEIELIKFYGRRNNKTGILTNLTDGGEGTSGKFHTEKTKTIIKEKKLKRLQAGEVIKHSEEWKLHLRLNNAGGKATAQKINQLDKDMNLIKEWPSANQASKELNLSKGNICNAAGKRKDWKVGGWFWRWVE